MDKIQKVDNYIETSRSISESSLKTKQMRLNTDKSLQV